MAEKERYVQVDGRELKITNPDKIWFPEAGIKKWDFILYCARLASISPALLQRSFADDDPFSGRGEP
jgi:DNA primase